METILETRRNILEDSNLAFVGSLIRGIKKSKLPTNKTEMLINLIKNMHFGFDTLYRLCYSHLDISTRPYENYLKKQLEQGTMYGVWVVDTILEALRTTENLSVEINDYFEIWRNDLCKNAEVALNYYSLKKCPVCDCVGHIHENLRNYGAYIGVGYICDCHKGEN